MIHPGALRALEFDRIVDAVRSFALTPTGAARLAALRPHTDARAVAQLQAATSEGVRYLNDNPLFPLRAPEDLEATLEALSVQGRPLEPIRLLALSQFLESVEHARTSVKRVGGSFPLLQQVVEGAASFKDEIADVRHKIDPAGDVADHASPALHGIRDRLRRQRQRLRGTLESYLRGKDTAKYLQDQVVTDRNGRYVLMVRAEHRSAIPGIIHGSSSTGASLFLEPLSTVEINNDIVALQEQEIEEIRRILLALTDAFRDRPLDLRRTVDVATELDAIQARARFSQLVDGIEPQLAGDGRLELRAARHPLLMPAVVARLPKDLDDDGEDEDEPRPRSSTPPAEGEPAPNEPSWSPRRADGPAPSERPRRSRESRGPVPVDILLIPPTTVLLITGPNTGGKTVAIKTAGLIAMMAQAGLHIPAVEGSSLPILKSLFADIGDEQSIAASLSTFSGHIANIVSMDRELALPALILVDEIGAGTDPVEGGALGIAIVEHFRQRGALLVATTHYDALKSYASTTTGVTSAAFGFDEHFAPTYRLIYGSPGRSLAIEIAARLGLNPAVIAAARANLTDREAQLAAHLAKVDEDLRALEHEKRLVARERETIDETAGRMKQREEVLRHREDSFRQRLNEQLETRLREARREIDDVIKGLKDKTEQLARDAARQTAAAAARTIVSTGETGAVRADARAAVDEIVDRLRQDHTRTAAAEPPGGPVTVGARVAVGGLGLEGTVVALHGNQAEIDVRGKRMRSRLGELRVLAGPPSTPARARVNVNVEMQPRDALATDLNLIGCRVDEALERAERFLDESLLADQHTVRLIHGYGEGKLRRALAEWLRRHPLVANYQTAPPEQGGGGVTIVELKE